MKKLVLLLVCLVFVYAELVIEREFDSKYQQEVCGDDYGCSAYEDFIPNVDILEAFKQDLQKEIKSPRWESRGLIYQQIITLPLPKDNESLKETIFIKMKNNRDDVVEYKVEVELIKSKNKLVIVHFIEAEETIKTFIKTPKGVKILNKTSAG